MPPKRRRRFQGLYYHSSPPKVLPMNGQASNHGRRRRDVDDFSIKLSTIRIWMHEKDIGKLTRILWAGQGSRLCQQASTNPRVKRFLSAVPYVMNSIKDVHQAVIDNTLETLQAKMEPPVPPALITCRDANGLNLIHKAAGLGHTKILEYLISIWPDGVSETDITGKTPLHWAASHKNNMRCYTLLTQAGCDEEAMDYKMKTPTYYRHKPHEIERAFLVYVPEAPRVSPDVATDWEALSEEVVDGAKKLELKVPDTNGRTTDDSIENTSEVDLNDGISATEEEHAATPTANGNSSDVVPLDDVKAETENEESTNAGDAEENGIETRDDNGGVAINGNAEAEEQHENGAEVETLESAAADETNMKTLTETTTTKNGSGEQAEQTESETVAAEERSSGANESEHVDERDTSEKEKDADVTTIKKEIEANVLSKENEEGQKGNEKLLNEANEQDTGGKENGEVEEGSKNEGTEEEEKVKTTELTTEDTKLEDQTQDAEKECEIEETKEENKENEDEQPEQEKGIVEKMKESAKNLADNIKKAIGVETEEMDADANKLAEKINDKMEELEESVKKDNETEEIHKNEKQAQEEGENEKDDGAKENEQEEIKNDIKKDKKDNENENIKNQGDEKEANLEKSDSAGNDNEVENENEKEGNKKEESENKKEENESEEKKEDNKPDNDVVEKDDANNVQKNNEETLKNESEVKAKLNDEKTDSSKENETEAHEEVANKENLEQEKEKKIDNETKGNANTNDNNENAQAQSEQNKEDKDMAEVKENTKEIKTEATKANDKTEENVSNMINGQLDKATEDIEKKSETVQENGELDGKEEMQKEAGEPKSAVEMRNAMGEQKHEKIPRLSTAKVTGNKRNGSSKRKSSGKKSASKLVEGVHEEGDDDDDDDDDDEDDEESYIREAIDSGDMEQLAQIVLNGDGGKLKNLESSNPDIQAFLNNVPNYMSKIRRVHEAAREGSLLALQQALDRRKFAIAKDEVSPNGATPLHVAVLFGNSDIVRYLAARFPETTTIADNDGRIALHYAATINDNGHFYNILTQLGANSKTVDKLGNTPEFYQNNEKAKEILNYKQLLSTFGAEELADELLNDQVPDDLHSSRRQLQDTDINRTLERCFSLIEESSKVLSGTTASALAQRKPLSASPQQLTVISYLSRFLKLNVYEKIRQRQTRLDHNLFDVIWPAFRKTSRLRRLEEDINCGIIAPDFDVFVVFQEFFVTLIKDMHCMDINEDFKPHPRIAFYPMENGKRLNTAAFIFDDESNLIQRCSVECSRNLDEFELPLNLNIGQVEQAERLMMSKLFNNRFIEAIGETESGNYYTLTEVLEEKSEINAQLSKLGLLIPLPNTKDAVQAAESLAFNGSLWPYGRGVYINSAHNLAIWLNCEEHLRVIATVNDALAPNMGAAYTRVGRVISFLERELHFKESYFLGYLQARPSYLGTGLKFTITIKLPNLLKEVDNLRHLCSVRGLNLITNQMLRSGVQLVNMQSLGVIEYVLFQDYCTAVSNIVSLEKDMSLTNSKHVASMLLKIFRRKKNSLVE